MGLVKSNKWCITHADVILIVDSSIAIVITIFICLSLISGHIMNLFRRSYLNTECRIDKNDSSNKKQISGLRPSVMIKIITESVYFMRTHNREQEKTISYSNNPGQISQR